MKYNTLRKESTSLTKCIGKWPRKQSIPNFPKNEHFLPPDTHFYVCISEGKKCSFFGKLDVLCSPVTSVLRFTLLPYYWHIGNFKCFCCFYVLECSLNVTQECRNKEKPLKTFFERADLSWIWKKWILLIFFHHKLVE